MEDREILNQICSDKVELRGLVSPEGVTVFLLLVAESAIARANLEEDRYIFCLKFLNKAIDLLAGEVVSPKVFEDMILTDNDIDGIYGFLHWWGDDNSENEFWKSLAAIAAAFGMRASQNSGIDSYLADPGGGEGLHNIFSGWDRKIPDFINANLLILAYKYVYEFHSEADYRETKHLDFSSEKINMLRWLAKK